MKSSRLCVLTGSITVLVAAAPAAAGAPARDPKIVKLAKAALACKLEDGYFADSCPAFKAWSDNEELFADGKGDETVLSMLGDADLKVRALAAAKGFESPVALFADKAHAAALFAAAAKETDSNVARTIASYVGRIDADKLGMAADLRALAKHPVVAFRENLSAVITYFQTPAAVDAITALIADPDRGVRRAAISALSSGGITPGVEPVCALLTKQFQRTDDLVGDALWAGSSSKCPGMDKQVIAELTKRTADPTKVTNSVGIGYTLAASGVCTRTKAAELKKAGFAIGKKLVDAKLPDANTRSAGASVLVDCDPAQATAALTALARDKDSFVAKAASEKLARLKKS